MNNDQKKYTIQTTVGFDNSAEIGLNFLPTKIEFLTHFDKMLSDMQIVTDEVVRVINHNEFHHFIHGMITDSGPRFRQIVDESYNYKATKETIQNRISSDFQIIEQRTEKIKDCAEIYIFDQEFDFESFK